MNKFRSIGKGGFKEDGQVEPLRKRNMKPSEVNFPVTAGIESELEDLRKKILEAKGPSDPITRATIAKLEEDLDKEMTRAFISMGLQDKILSLKLELERSSNPKQAIDRHLKEKADEIVQEFKQKLSRPGAYLGLKQKLQTLSAVRRLIKLKVKREKLKTELNQKIPSDIKTKMDILKKARDNSSLDGNLAEEIQIAVKKLEEVLKSANLEIVGKTRREHVISQLDIKEKIFNINKEIRDEISSVVVKEGVRKKIEELKVEIAKGSSPEKVKKLEEEIKKEIAGALSVSPLKEKVENLRSELASNTKDNVEAEVGAENGR